MIFKKELRVLISNRLKKCAKLAETKTAMLVDIKIM
jgi:hypothetical protein